MSKRIVTLCVVLLLALELLAPGAAGTARAGNPSPTAPPRSDFFQGLYRMDPDARISVANYRNPPSPICATAASGAANVNTDCETNGMHNETSIAVNPTNPNNLVASANDIQFVVNQGGNVYATWYSRARATFDGGRTWTTYPINFNNYTETGDPAVAFDADGAAYLATLGGLFSQGNFCCLYPDMIVATSLDGGKTWALPVRVAAGTGAVGGPGVFNDKEYIAAWGHGNAIATWTVFNLGLHGSYINAPIYASVTHDGGRTWSAGVPVSGSAPFCVGAAGDNACDQDQFSSPVVGADGRIYVAFENYSDQTTGRSQYLVVQVDPATGQRLAGPVVAARLVDGAPDYPISIDGRQTYQDSEFDGNSGGNLAADPENAGHLALTWSDMRDSVLPAPGNPYSATTNSDVSYSESYDGGATWSAARVLARPNDQFQPYATFDPSSRLRIGFYDRAYDPANQRYGYTLATVSAPGTVTYSQLTTALSDPTANNRWFAHTTVDPNFPLPTTFLGDYSNVAAIPGGGVVALWTDLRQQTTFAGRSGWGQNVFFATAP